MASPNCFASTTAASQGGFSSNVSREKLKIKIYLVDLAIASKHRSDILFGTKMKRGKAFLVEIALQKLQKCGFKLNFWEVQPGALITSRLVHLALRG